MNLATIYLSASVDEAFDASVQTLGAEFIGSAAAESRRTFLRALAQAVEECDAILATGALFGPDGLLEIIEHGLGLEAEAVDWAALGVKNGDASLRLPRGAIPLLTDGGDIGGAVLESGGQSIILLTDDASVRDEMLTLYLEPYLLAKAEDAPPAPAPETAQKAAVQTQAAAEPSAGNPPAGKAAVQSKIDNDALLADLEAEEPAELFLPMQPEDGARPSRAKRLLLCVCLPILLAALLLTGGYFGYELRYIPGQSDRVYAQAREDYGQNGETALPSDVLLKFWRLREQNPDLVGWLRCEQAGLDYPVVTSAAQSSGYYAEHLFNGQKNKYGTPYMNGEFDSYVLLQNMVIYGTNYQDGRMFAGLERYLDLDFYKSAPILTMDTLYEEASWKIFGVLLIEKDTQAAGFDYRASNFFNEAAAQQYVDEVRRRSVISCGVDALPTDRMLTLVTQYSKDSSKNVVLVARKTRLDENGFVDTASASLNTGEPAALWTMQYTYPAAPAIRFLTEPEASAPSEAEPSDPNSQASPGPDDSSSGSANLPDGGASSASAPPMQAEPSSAAPQSVPDVPPTPAAPPPSGGSEETPSAPSVPEGSGSAADATLWVKNGSRVESGPAAEIVARVIEAEMGSGFEYEALKAQAVATYSFLLYQGADRSPSNPPSVPMKAPSAKSLSAAREVCGQRIYYNGAPCSVLYFAMSAGKTANASDLWYGAPHLVSVDSSIEIGYASFETKVTYHAADVARWILQEYGFTPDGDKNGWFRVTYDSNDLYAREVVIGGSVTVRGYQLRENLFTAARVGSSNMLRSHAYRIAYDPGSDCFLFTVKGYGHGVGLSQIGANLYAKQGWDYLQILRHYYTGVTIA